MGDTSPRMRKPAIQLAAFAISAVATTADAVLRYLRDISSSRRRIGVGSFRSEPIKGIVATA